jgi:hypothetical protein
MKAGALRDMTCLIPLYRSKRFLTNIEANIEEHLSQGSRVLVSDMHGHDDVPELLKARYGNHENVTILSDNSQGDWVDNVNLLIRHTETRFARIMPHDDTAIPGSSAALLALLLRDPEAILATGRVRCIDMQGNPKPDVQDQFFGLEKYVCPANFAGALSFFWLTKFTGCFQGVFDARKVRERQLYIHKTPMLVAADHVWMTAMFLAGRFLFLPKVTLVKRYYADSTHKGWSWTPEACLGIADVMYGYFKEQVADEGLLMKARFVIYHNAIRWARYFEHEVGQFPEYSPLSPK